MKYALIVYQGGIANVFEVESPIRGLRLCDNKGHRRRLFQADFRACENFARGLMAAGVKVRVASCNVAGDVADRNWTPGLTDCPFREEACPPIFAR